MGISYRMLWAGTGTDQQRRPDGSGLAFSRPVAHPSPLHFLSWLQLRLLAYGSLKATESSTEVELYMHIFIKMS